MKRELKKSVVYSLYIVSFLMLIGAVTIIFASVSNNKTQEFQYVSKGILDYENNIKVVKNTDIIKRPYIDNNVIMVKSFYDYLGDEDSQQKSLIYYEGTYMQSTGVSYSNGSEFDVTSILKGTIKDITEDVTLGNTITIDHGNGITSVYQSIKEINIKVGDEVAQGQIIAKSSTSNISTELDNHLYFELIIDGVCVNPENYYDKSVNEL